MSAEAALRTTLLGTFIASIAIAFAPVNTNPASAGGGGCHGSPTKEADGTRVELILNCFSPTVLNIEPGETVTFENMDLTPHDIAGVAGLWGVNGPPISQGATASITFTEPGLYPYSCLLHYGMTGVISVGDARSVGGTNAGALRVSRLSAGAPNSDAQPEKGAVTSAPAESSGASGLRLAGGGLAAGALLASGAFALRARRRV